MWSVIFLDINFFSNAYVVDSGYGDVANVQCTSKPLIFDTPNPKT